MSQAERATKAQVLHGPDLAYRVGRLQRRHYQAVRSATTGLQDAERQGQARLGSYPTFLRETFADFYSGGRLQELEGRSAPAEASLVRRLHQLRREVPELGRLADRCRGDGFNSALATTAVAQGLQEAIPDHQRDVAKARQLVEGLRSLGDQAPQELVAQAEAGLQEALAEAEAKAQELDPSTVRRALRRVAAQASEELDGVERAMAACGWDLSSYSERGPEAENEKAELARLLEDSPKLRRVLELVGRMTLLARRAQAEKVRHGAGELADVEAGAELARLLPSEAMLLAEPDLEVLFLGRLLERNLLQYRLQDREPAGKGPIVVLVDDSGSMKGPREIWAKALALALLGLARSQGRSFALATYGERVRKTLVDTASRRRSPVEVLRVLAPGCGGGTDWLPALSWGLDQVGREADLREADLLLVTDGLSQLADPGLVRRIAQGLGARIHGLVVGSEAKAPVIDQALRAFCDEVHSVAGLLERDAGQRDTLSRGERSVLSAILSL